MTAFPDRSGRRQIFGCLVRVNAEIRRRADGWNALIWESGARGGRWTIEGHSDQIRLVTSTVRQ